MPDEFQETRSGADRRQMPDRTSNCATHESRMDKVDADINRFKGWSQAAVGFWGVAVMAISWFGVNINTKLDNIQSSIMSDKSDIRLLNEQMKNLQIDVVEIQTRHRQQDQTRYQTLPK